MSDSNLANLLDGYFQATCLNRKSADDRPSQEFCDAWLKAAQDKSARSACTHLFDRALGGNTTVDDLSSMVTACTSAMDGGHISMFGVDAATKASKVASCMLGGDGDPTCDPVQHLMAVARAAHHVQTTFGGAAAPAAPAAAPAPAPAPAPTGSGAIAVQDFPGKNSRATAIPMATQAQVQAVAELNRAIASKDAAAMVRACSEKLVTTAAEGYLGGGGDVVCNDSQVRKVDEMGSSATIRGCALTTLEEACGTVLSKGLQSDPGKVHADIAARCFKGASPPNVSQLYARLLANTGSVCERATTEVFGDKTVGADEAFQNYTTVLADIY